MKDAVLNFLIVVAFGYAATSFVFKGTDADSWNYFVSWAAWLIIGFCWSLHVYRVQRQPVRRRVS